MDILWDFVAATVLNDILDWFYSQIVGFLGAFFTQMGSMGVELFEMEWVQAVVQFFSQLAWALFGVSLVVRAFECGIEYSGGRANPQQAALDVLKGFLAVSLFTTVLYGGYYIYCMGIRQGLRMPCTTLFDGLSVAGKLIWCSILVGIKTFLWSLLFVIPGIVAAYRYRFALYNVLTDDSLSAGEAIRLSCEQTRGLKATLFVLDLSFIGWSLLASLTMGILNIWVMPYLVLCDLAYFEDAQRRLGRSPYGGSSSDSVPPPPEWEL